MNGQRHIALLMGGFSAEREVSLATGRACLDALAKSAFKITPIDADRSLPIVLDRLKPDSVFNALHGSWGEDGCVQGLLETLAIPYTHSGVLASALAMHKFKAKEIFRGCGLPVAEGRLLSRQEAARAHPLDPPYVVKPAAQGSSRGVFIVPEGAEAPPAALGKPDWSYGDLVLAERYVPGVDLSCGVVGEKALPVMEMRPQQGFYDYSSKYDPDGAEHIMPADLPSSLSREVQRITLAAHRALGCRGVSRADFRFSGEGESPVLLEVNTQPGLTPTSLLPELAAHDGMDFPALLHWMIEDSSCPR